MWRIMLVVILLVAVPSICLADTREIFAEGKYIMGDGETPSVAKERALLEAKRNAVEQAGTYVESITEVKSMQLTRDDIRVVASGVLQTTILDTRRELSGEALTFTVKVKCLVDSDDLRNKQINYLLQAYREIQTDLDNCQHENTQLRQQLLQARSNVDKKTIETKIALNERSLMAIILCEKGIQLRHKKDYDKAISIYNEAISFDPKYYRSWANRGNIYLDRGDLDLAMADYNNALQLSPNDFKLFHNRALIYMRLQQYQQALTSLNQSISLNANFADNYIQRAICYESVGNFSDALVDYNRAISLAPKYARPYQDRGILYEQLGKYSESIRDYDMAIMLDPNDDHSYSCLGNAYSKIGNFNSAITAYETAIRLNSSTNSYYYGMAYCYEQIGQLDKAIKYYFKSTELNPREFRSYFRRAFLLEKVGRISEAVESFRLFTQYAPLSDQSSILKAKEKIMILQNNSQY